ncbi:hypothetical protein N2152v2_007807 [Parachlorella kessleri]
MGNCCGKDLPTAQADPVPAAVSSPGAAARAGAIAGAQAEAASSTATTAPSQLPAASQPVAKPQPAEQPAEPPAQQPAQQVDTAGLLSLLSTGARKTPPGHFRRSLLQLGVSAESGSQPRFDNTVNLLTSIYQVTHAAVAMVDGDQVSLRAKVPADLPDVVTQKGTFIDYLFRHYTEGMLVVADALADPRFKDNWTVRGSLSVRFYAGAPLVSSDGKHCYGALFIADNKPRKFQAQQLAVLASFADGIVRELERDEVLRQQQDKLRREKRKHRRLVQALQQSSEGVCLVDCSQAWWPILYANDTWVARTGIPVGPPLEEQGFWGLFVVQTFGLPVDTPIGREGAAPGWSAGSRAGGGGEQRRAAIAAAVGVESGSPIGSLEAERAAREAVSEGAPFNLVVTSASGEASPASTLLPTAMAPQVAGGPGSGPQLLRFRLRPSDMAHPQGPGIPGLVRMESDSEAGASSAAGGADRLQQPSRQASAALSLSSQPQSPAPPPQPSQQQQQQQPTSPFRALQPPSKSPRASLEQQPARPAGGPASDAYGLKLPGSSSAASQSVSSPFAQPDTPQQAEQAPPPQRSLPLAQPSLGASSLGTSDWLMPSAGPERLGSSSSISSVHSQLYVGLVDLFGSSSGSGGSGTQAGDRLSHRTSSRSAAARTSWDVAAFGAAEAQQLEPDGSHSLPQLMREVSLGNLIGSGSFGKCYKGEWHGHPVAVKVLERTLGPASTKGPLYESLLSRTLAHPHVVTTYDYAVGPPVSRSTEASRPVGNEVRQEVWIVQSYCNRGSLLRAIEKGKLNEPDGTPDLEVILSTAWVAGPCPEALLLCCALHAAADIAGALEYLHVNGLVHGDLSCNNVLLASSNKDRRRWIAQVVDFGLSRVLSSTIVQTNSLRTVTHMPPELLMEGKLTAAVDVYSLGVLLWEMWQGKRAWERVMPVHVISAVLTKGLAAPESAPPDLKALIDRCLARNPADRPSIKEVLADLSSMLRQASRQQASSGSKAR